MLHLALELTNRCDIACLHCLRDKDDTRQDLDTKFVIRMFDEAKQIGAQYISFTGGEPTLHPDYILLIDELTKRGLLWVTVTNGHNLELLTEVFSDRRRLEMNDKLVISLDGATEEVHDKIRGKGSFRKIMRTTNALVARGVKILFQMILTQTNIVQMEELALLASNLGISAVNYGFLQPTKKNVLSNLMPSPEDFRRAQIRVAQLKGMFTIPINHTFGFFNSTPMIKCSILSSDSMNVDYQGNMIFCCQLSNYGDITYVPDRQEIVADLNKVPLLEGYQVMLTKIYEYNKLKAERASQGKIKGLDYFPCHYCTKCFGKLNWLHDEDVKDHPSLKPWQEDQNYQLSEALFCNNDPTDFKEKTPRHSRDSLKPNY